MALAEPAGKIHSLIQYGISMPPNLFRNKSYAYDLPNIEMSNDHRNISALYF
jgi:hypothetical protein